ncbi:hypothetical protein QEN19_002410 [Hanseniaspora menglaensis]
MSSSLNSDVSVGTNSTSVLTSVSSQATGQEGASFKENKLVSMFDVNDINIIKMAKAEKEMALLNERQNKEKHSTLEDLSIERSIVPETSREQSTVNERKEKTSSLKKLSSLSPEKIITPTAQNSGGIYGSSSASDDEDLISTHINNNSKAYFTSESFSNDKINELNTDEGPHVAFKITTSQVHSSSNKQALQVENQSDNKGNDIIANNVSEVITGENLPRNHTKNNMQHKSNSLINKQTDKPASFKDQIKREEIGSQLLIEQNNSPNDQLSQSFYNRKNSTTSKKSQKKNSSSSSASTDGPKMIFEKRKISLKPRTHSIQSVLSNVSSRNVLSRHSTHDDSTNYTSGDKTPTNQTNSSMINGPIYGMMYNPSQQVQSPAMMTTLKKVRSSIQLNNPPLNQQGTNLTSIVSNGHKRQLSTVSNYSNIINYNNSSSNLAGLRGGSYEAEKVLIGERVPFVSRDGDSDILINNKNNDEDESNNNKPNNDLQLTKKPSAKNNNDRTFSNTDDIINNDLIEWKNGSVTSMVSGTLTTYKPNRLINNTNKRGVRTSDGSDVIEDDASDTDSVSEKKLTTDALKKLNLLQQQKKNKRKASIVSQTSTNSSLDSPTRLRSYNSFQKRDNDPINEEQRQTVDQLVEEEVDNGYEDTIGKDISSLSFFGKNIIMDSTIVPRKHSVAPIKPSNNEYSAFPSKKPTAANEHKKKQQQIDIPKKPLYTPAVMRDINETKISNDVLLKRALSPSLNRNSNIHQNLSDVSSVLETASVNTYETSTSTWSRLMHLFNGSSSNTDLSQTTTASFKTPKHDPITRKHWIPDDERNACFDCSTKFNLFERRHHCRHCGEIFCFRHLRHYLYLNSQAHFIIGATGLGRLAKVCDSCLDKYEDLLVTGSGALGVEEEESGPNAINGNNANGGIDGNGGGLPEDWYWSSF